MILITSQPTSLSSEKVDALLQKLDNLKHEKNVDLPVSIQEEIDLLQETKCKFTACIDEFLSIYYLKPFHMVNDNSNDDGDDDDSDYDDHDHTEYDDDHYLSEDENENDSGNDI